MKIMIVLGWALKLHAQINIKCECAPLKERTLEEDVTNWVKMVENENVASLKEQEKWNNGKVTFLWIWRNFTLIVLELEFPLS